LKWTPELLGLIHIDIAMWEGQHAITELILERAGSRIKSLSERRFFGSRRSKNSWPREPLNLAVELGLTHTAGQLTSLYGAYYAHDTDWRWDLFDDACGFGHPEIACRLLDDIIELDDREYRDFKRIMYTLLYDPLRLDQSSKEQRGQRIFTVVECLLERLPWLAYDKNFLFRFVGGGWEELVDLFLRHGAQIDVSNRAEMQRLLHEAIEGDNPSLVARMLDLGADVGSRCLHSCGQEGKRFRTAMQVVAAGVTCCGEFIPDLSKRRKPNSV
jgi:ankyrin repeat protein